MKKSNILLSIAILLTVSLFSQAPKTFNYQSVIRNSSGEIIANSNISLKISILSGSISGSSVCTEEHSITTNAFGIISIELGSVNSVDFQAINWGANKHFVKVEIDVDGGTNYTEMGTSQLLSVPYALHANTVENSDDADADPNNEIQELSVTNNSLSISNANSVELPTPTNFEHIEIADSAKIGANGMMIHEIIKISGTLSETDQNTIVYFPADYTNYNCYVMSLLLKPTITYFSSTRYGLGYTGTDGTVSYTLRYSYNIGTGTSSRYINIMYPSSLMGYEYEIVLMKFE